MDSEVGISLVSACRYECRPGDIDHAEPFISLAVENIAGKAIAWSHAVGKPLDVDVPLRIEWNLGIPVIGEEPFRLACGTASPISCRTEVAFKVITDEISRSAGSKILDKFIGGLDYLSGFISPDQRVNGAPGQGSCARSCKSGKSEGSTSLHQVRLASCTYTSRPFSGIYWPIRLPAQVAHVY